MRQRHSIQEEVPPLTTRTLIFTALVMLTSAACWAGSISYDATVAPDQASWEKNVSLPAYDPALGELTAVRLTISGAVSGSASVECLDAESQSVDASIGADVSLLTESGYEICSISPKTSQSIDLHADDGSTDFGGASGAVVDVDSDTLENGITIESGLGGFVGPGNIQFVVVSSGMSSAEASGNVSAQLACSSGATVTVTYIFE